MFLPPRFVTQDRLPAHVNSLLTEESVMSIIAWVVLDLAAGTLAKILVRGRGSPGFAVTGTTGVHRAAWL
jgi:hypothetical protein